MKKHPIVVLAALETEARAVAELGLGLPVVLTGVGKVAAAMHTQRAIDVYQPSGLVFVGVAGSLNPKLEPMSVCIGRDAAQWDVDLTAFGQLPGTLNDGRRFFPFNQTATQLTLRISQGLGFPTNLGRVISGDAFLADPAKARWLQETFEADAIDMESAAAIQVATDNQIPMVLVRVISDSAGDEAEKSFDSFLSAAAERAAAILHQFLPQWAEILDG